MKLMESSIPNNLTLALKDQQCNWNPSDTYKLYQVIFRTMAEVATLNRKEDSKTVISCRDLKGNLIIAAILEWHQPDEEMVDGNWTFTFTTEQQDVEGCMEYDFANDLYRRVFTTVGLEMFNMRISDAIFITKYSTIAMNVLLEALRVNAKEGAEFEIEEDEFFKARSGVEDGSVVIGIDAGAKIKELIKNDATTSVA